MQHHHGRQGDDSWELPEIKLTRDTLKFLQVIEQHMYSNGSEELHMVHNQVMSTISLLGCNRKGGSHHRVSRTSSGQWGTVGIRIGQTEQEAKTVLKRDGVRNPKGEQLKEAEKLAAEWIFCHIVSIHGGSARKTGCSGYLYLQRKVYTTWTCWMTLELFKFIL